MDRPPFELADVFRRHLSAYHKHRPLTLRESRVASAILRCRTAALGGHVYRCQSCSYKTDISYNSCRNRHCPKCQGPARRLWVQEREKELLPVGYFHVVFTLPAPLADLALSNKRRLYEILFSSASKSLLKVAACRSRSSSTPSSSLPPGEVSDPWAPRLSNWQDPSTTSCPSSRNSSLSPSTPPSSPTSVPPSIVYRDHAAIN